MGSATISLDRDTFLRSNFDWRPLPSSVVSDLQQRLKAIEGLIRGGGGAPSSFQDDVLTPSSNPTAARSESQAGTVHSTTPHVQSHTHGDSQAIAQISNGPEEHNAIDGMAITVSEGDQASFFGGLLTPHLTICPTDSLQARLLTPPSCARYKA